MMVVLFKHVCRTQVEALKTGIRSILLILLLAAGLRFAGITYDSLWLDESYQTMCEAVGQKLPDFLSGTGSTFLFKLGPPKPVAEMLKNFRSIDPLCPPLYAVALNRWMSLFGESDFAVRSMSVLFSLCSLTALYAFSRYFFGEHIADVTALLMAVSPFDIYYAQEARMYELLMFCAICSSTCLLLLIHRFCPLSEGTNISSLHVRTRGDVASSAWSAAPAVAYAFFTWAMINTHYTGLFILLFQVLFAVAATIKARSINLIMWLALGWLLVGTLWLPWVKLFTQAAALRNAAFYVMRIPTWWWPPWALLVKVPLNWLSFLSGKRVFVLAVPLYFTSTLMLAAGIRKALRSLPYAFLLCWLILPAVFIWLMDVVEGHRVVEISRYLIGTAPAAYVLAAIGISSYLNCQSDINHDSNRATVVAGLSRLGTALLATHMFFALVNNAAAHTVPQREPWKEMACLVHNKCKPDDLIVVSHYIDIVCLDRYLTEPHAQIGVSPGLGSAEIARRLDKVKRFWLLTAQEGEDVRALVPGRFTMNKEINLHHGLHLRLYTDKS